MAALEIKLFGAFEARLQTGERLALKGRKAQALLARLALKPGVPCARETLMALLWSARGDEQARASLRQALAELRRACKAAGAAPLLVARDAVTLDPEAVSSDVAAFERALAEGAPDALARATELYAGPLLAGFASPDPAFDEWLRDERARLSELAGEALGRLLRRRAEAGETGAAIATARSLLALDPLHESVHRTLMELYAATGERTLALKQFQACSEVLRAELGVEPEAETRRLRERILAVQDTRSDGGSDLGSETEGEAASRAGAPTGADGGPLPLPDKPSIAVLPLTNMSGDAEQDYFGDGITEDIITELSRFGELFVIARNSCFAYKGRSVKVQEIGRDLGVQYVLEGSVRKASDRVRISVQLVEAASGTHVWAERYDRQLEDLFAVQDEVVQTIVGTLVGRIEHYDAQRAKRAQTRNLRAYDYAIQGRQHYYRFSREANLKARALIEKALALDPEYGAAISALAETHWMDWWTGWVVAPGESFGQYITLSHRLLALDDNYFRAQYGMGWVYAVSRDYERARYHFDRAAALTPHDANVRMEQGLYAMLDGRHDEATVRVQEASRLNPFGRYNYALGLILFAARRYDEAIAAFSATRGAFPQVHAMLAAAYAQAGRPDEARAAAATYARVAREEMEVAEAKSGVGWSGFFAERLPFRKDPDLAHLVDGLAKAGLA